MALSVYLVDGNTRLIMPDTAWAEKARRILEDQGHSVDLTDEDPELCMRDAADLARRHALLEQIP